MGPLLSAAASIGKEFLVEKAADLLKGKDKELNNETNEVQNEVPVEDNSEPVQTTVENEYHSASDDNPAMNDVDSEGSLPESEFSADKEIVTIPDNDGRGSTRDKYNTEANYYTGITQSVPNPEYNPRARKNKQPEFLEQDMTYDNNPIKVGDGGNISFNQQITEPTIPYSEREGTSNNRLRIMGTRSGEPTWEDRFVGDVIRDRADNYDETMKMIRDYANDHPVGGFLNQTRGMSPSVSIENSLNEAVDKGDTEEVENIIEEHPEESQEALPEDTPIQEEAEQITEDTTPQNDEVNNEVVEDFVKENNQFKDIDWDKVKVYEPGEDPYPKVSDESDWANNQDYEPSEGADVYLHHDEDFAGPDELPATIDQIRDEDFVGPDEQLAEYNGGLPTENQYEPVYDTSDYNFDWDYDIQTLGVKSPEEIPDAPVHNKEQAKAKQRLMKWFKSKRLNQNGQSGPVDSASSDTSNGRLSMAGRRAGALSVPASGSGSVPSASMGNGAERQPAPSMNGSIASKAPLPIALEDNQGKIVSVNGKSTTMPLSSKNGSMRSGSFGLMGKHSGTSTKVGKPAGATSSGAYHTQSNGSVRSKIMGGMDVVKDGKEVLVERIRELLKNLPDEQVSKLGFSPARNTYNGVSLENYDGYTLQNLIKQLEKLIGDK